jgi:predicted metalloprotease
MRWDDFRRSDNIEDRRAEGGVFGGGGGLGGLPIRGGHIGFGSLIVLLLVSWLFGINPLALLGFVDITDDTSQTQEAPSPGSSGQASNTAQDQTRQFVAAVLGDTEDRWSDVFQAMGRSYEPTKLVLFSGATRSACGTAEAAMGPFYCPNDRKIYLDTAFFREIETRLHGCSAGGDSCRFSQAYVVAHEVGHHVQDLLGILGKARQQQQRATTSGSNHIQVQIELQADCLAGMWANHSEQKWKFLEPGDIEAALQTASAIGDDILQKRAQGYVVPDSFTHGTSAQRIRWFSTGLKQGTLQACDTFAAVQP